MDDFSAAGLTETEAKCYTALLSQKEWKPADLAKTVGETRTNAYKILDNLVALGLAKRFDKAKKLHYRATNPSRLLELAREQRTKREEAEERLELNAHNLMAEYIKTYEQPGIRFFQGPEGIKQIYDDQLETKEPIYFIQTHADKDFYGFDFMHELRNQFPPRHIKRFGIMEDHPTIPKDLEKIDKRMLLSRTFMAPGSYTAPVEWDIYGEKVAIISFGKEAMGTIIESPQIAESLRQLFKLLDEGLRRQPGYQSLPKLNRWKADNKHKVAGG